MSALHSIAAFIALMTPLATVADEKPVDSAAAVKQWLLAISQELIANWGIIDETDSYGDLRRNRP